MHGTQPAPSSRRAAFMALGAAVLSLSATASDAEEGRPRFRFEDRTAASGLVFQHEEGGSGRRYVVEIVGGGVLVFDYDGDARPDVLFVNGRPLVGDATEVETPGHRLYRNLGDGLFEDRTAEAGLLDPPDRLRYGMGGVAGDLDADGDPDLLLTHFGAERLFWNRGDGTFFEAEGAAGATDDQWSTSAVLFDPDRDGDLDMYVANYLEWSVGTHRDCVSPVKQVLAYCHPQEYPGVPDSLFENRGDRTFRARPVPGSEDGKGLGVTVADFDGDLAPDVYVANDTTPNFLFGTTPAADDDDGEGISFVESGLASGVAYNEEGLPEAGMGTDWGDADRDGRPDLIVTNFDFETNTLYRNLGGGLFLDATAASGLGAESLTELGFGVDFADFDNDGWLDLAVANGHILDNIAEIQTNLAFAQPGQLFLNDGGIFRASAESAGDLGRARVGRGLASFDHDRDGDLDLVLSSNRGRAELLVNQGGSEAGRSVGVLLVGVASNRDGIGASVRLIGPGALSQIEERRAGSSFLSQHEAVLWFGLGTDARTGLVEVVWPSGRTEPIEPLAAGAVHVLKEGRGRVGGFRFRPSRPSR